MAVLPGFMQTLDSILARTRVAGERSVAMARLLVAFMLVSRTLALGAPLLATRPLVLFTMLLVNICWNLVVRRALSSDTEDRHAGVIGGSVLIEALTVWGGLAALAVWPPTF